MIIDIKINDLETYAEYIEKVGQIVLNHKGKYLARGGEILKISPEWKSDRIVIIEFPSMEDLKACFNSKEYKEIAPLITQSTVSKAIAVEGVEKQGQG
jgi:uncharacterized protein (DUF1330 family)